MAIIKSVKGGIKSVGYLEKAINYIINPENTEKELNTDNHLKRLVDYASKKEKAAFITTMNCERENINEQWNMMRSIWDKNSGILAHHYIQSYSPEENVTPEQVHQMGLELVERVFKNYQVILSTHVDRNHIHNHIIVNSCNILSGDKWLSNKTTLNALRAINDDISLKHGLSIITSTSGISKGIMYGKNVKSYAKHLVAKDVLQCLDLAKTQNEFTELLSQKGYLVRYGKQITFKIKDADEKRRSAFRGDTLAKEFGNMFTTKNIYDKLGINIDIQIDDKKVVDEKKAEELLESEEKKVYAVEFEADEKYAIQFKNLERSLINKDSEYKRYYRIKEIENILQSNKYSLLDVRRIILYIYLKTQLFRRKISKPFLKKYVPNNAMRYTMKHIPMVNTLNGYTRVFGNIKFNSLMMMEGRNITVKVDLDKIPLLLNAPFYYFVSLKEDGQASIVCKVHDIKMLESILGIKIKQIKTGKDSLSVKRQNRNAALRSEWKKNKIPLKYKNNLTESQVIKLRSAGVEFVDYPSKANNNLSSIVYPEKFERKVYELLYPDLSPVNCNISRDLFDRIALNHDYKKAFKVISAEQYNKLIHTIDIEIPSVVYKSKKEEGKYNLVYFAKDEEKLRGVILNEYELLLNNRPYGEWRKNKVQVHWLENISSEQVRTLNLINARCAVFADNKNLGKYKIAFPFYEEKTVMSIIDAEYNVNNGSYSYVAFKQFLKENNYKSKSLEVTPAQLNAFKHITMKNYPSCVLKNKDGKLQLLCLESDYREIAELIDVKLPKSQLLMEDWKLSKVKLNWKMDLSNEQADSLKKCNCDIAMFKDKNGKINAAYPFYSEREVFTTLYPNKNPVTCNSNYKTMKKYAEQSGQKLRYKYISPIQYEGLVTGKEEFMSCIFNVENKEGYNLVYLSADEEKVQYSLSIVDPHNVSILEKFKSEDVNIAYSKNISNLQIKELKRSDIVCAFLSDRSVAYDIKNQCRVLALLSEEYYTEMKRNNDKPAFRKGLSEGEAETLLLSEIPCTLRYDAKSNTYTCVCNVNDVEKVKETLDNYNNNEPIIYPTI